MLGKPTRQPPTIIINGDVLPKRDIIVLQGDGITWFDDPANNRVVINIAGGGVISPDVYIFGNEADNYFVNENGDYWIITAR